MSGSWPDRQTARRAIEALRSGVPSRHSVQVLGTGQTGIEDRFGALLAQVTEGGRRSGGPPALLVGGGFGSGKSHLLTHLAYLAEQTSFVTSRVVVSKETPFYDPVKVLRAAVGSATGPAGVGDVIADAAAALDPDSPRYTELVRWLRMPGTDLDQRFEATLFLHERLVSADSPGADEEFVDAIVRFWSGDPLPVPDLRRQLRAVGAAGTFSFGPIKIKELARQRWRFLPRLLRAAGHAGWVVLLDEVELIGRYSLLQRGRSYAELAQWLSGDAREVDPPVVAVLAMTDDFEASVLSEKGDREQVPAKLRAKQTTEYDQIAARAEIGMRHIERDTILLQPPDDAELDHAYGTVRALHGTAYGWQPPDVAGLERLGASRMRQYVRAWINEWDLLRLDPAYRPQTETLEVASDYRELDEDPIG